MDITDAGAVLAGAGGSTNAAYPAEAQSLKVAVNDKAAQSIPDSPLVTEGLSKSGRDNAPLPGLRSTSDNSADMDAVLGGHESDTEVNGSGVEECEEIHGEEDEIEEDTEYMEEDPEEVDEEDYEYEPKEAVVDTLSTPSTSSPKLMITIGTRQYKASAFVKNRGLSYVPGKLKSNPKATFEACITSAPHNILDCQKLHLSNRGILVGDRFIRLNMFVDNPGKEAMLRNPARSLKMRICRRDAVPQKGETHDISTCSSLHLLPDILFIGIPGLRTAYFEAEVRHNLAFTKLKEQPWETQCGTWCRGVRSHVVTTCRFLHYNRGDNYTEKPTPPHRPLAAIPDLTPSRPPQATDSNRRGRRGGRGGRGGRGCGRGGGRGGRGRGRGGGGRGETARPLPAAFQPGFVASPQGGTPQATLAKTQESCGTGSMKSSSQYVAETGWITNTKDKGSAIDRWMLNLLLALLGIFLLLFIVVLRREETD